MEPEGWQVTQELRRSVQIRRLCGVLLHHQYLPLTLKLLELSLKLLIRDRSP
jgi:hypothetical protein